MRLKLTWIPQHGVWLVTLGALGHFIAKLTSGQVISVQLPLSPHWRTRYQRTGRVGWGLVVFGIVGFMAGTIISIVLSARSIDSGLEPDSAAKKNEMLANWALGATVACPVISIAGIVYLACGHKPIVKLRNLTSTYAWAEGACDAYLTSLPLWPGPQLEDSG